MSKLIHKFIDGDIPVHLHQVGPNDFCVFYGQQIKRRLTYAEAAAEYGECVFHSLACSGKLDNSTPGQPSEYVKALVREIKAVHRRWKGQTGVAQGVFRSACISPSNLLDGAPPTSEERLARFNEALKLAKLPKGFLA